MTFAQYVRAHGFPLSCPTCLNRLAVPNDRQDVLFGRQWRCITPDCARYNTFVDDFILQLRLEW